MRSRWAHPAGCVRVPCIQLGADGLFELPIKRLIYPEALPRARVVCRVGAVGPMPTPTALSFATHAG